MIYWFTSSTEMSRRKGLEAQGEVEVVCSFGGRADRIEWINNGLCDQTMWSEIGKVDNLDLGLE